MTPLAFAASMSTIAFMAMIASALNWGATCFNVSKSCSNETQHVCPRAPISVAAKSREG
eukprot:CAMPEP_0185758226 /NCGR_PEP_ID=MMETSP1174-20130828/16825_1 /TAXON_ID=35687 /ORGANISM="Dictyocha speculum, Strain CCMP1381" /LENGTH=58 /DNA_ID=CAMNT_0028437979 /DNA_START=133 /DNA_END=309 /DNA_ORIENTATION=-